MAEATRVVMADTGHRVPCVDLRATAGDRYRMAWDPAYDAERPDLRSVEAPWLTQIPGHFGFIPWGHRLLAAWCRMGGPKQAELLAIPGVTVQSGGRIQGRLCAEVIVTFDVDRLDEVAAVIRAKRRRVLSPEQRARLLAMGAAHHFQKGQSPGAQTPLERPESTNASPDALTDGSEER